VTHPRFSFPEQPARPQAAAAYRYVAFSGAVLQSLSAEPMHYCQWVYQQAWEQARAVLRPSWTERDLLGVWN
jgi:hypothetical protein